MNESRYRPAGDRWSGIMKGWDGYRIPRLGTLEPTGWVVDYGKFSTLMELVDPKIPVVTFSPAPFDERKPLTEVAGFQQKAWRQMVHDNSAVLACVPSIVSADIWLYGMVRIHRDLQYDEDSLLTLMRSAAHYRDESIARSLRIAYMIKTGHPVVGWPFAERNMHRINQWSVVAPVLEDGQG